MWEQITNTSCRHAYSSHGFRKSQLNEQTTRGNITARRRSTWHNRLACDVKPKPQYYGEIYAQLWNVKGRYFDDDVIQ